MQEINDWLDNQGIDITDDTIKEYCAAFEMWNQLGLDNTLTVEQILNKYVGIYVDTDEFVEEYLERWNVLNSLTNIELPLPRTYKGSDNIALGIEFLDLPYIWNRILNMGYFIAIQCQKEDNFYYGYHFIFNRYL